MLTIVDSLPAKEPSLGAVPQVNSSIHDVFNGNTNQAFVALTQHYRNTNFLYDAKMQRLRALWPQIETGWPTLFTLPETLFHCLVARRQEQIVSSICAYRDTDTTYVIEHAASEPGHPSAMAHCIDACLASIDTDPTFGYNKMYYRPENRWPSRMAQGIADAIGTDRSAFSTNNYLYCTPTSSLSSVEQQALLPVVELNAGDSNEAEALALKVLGPVLAGAISMRWEPEVDGYQSITLSSLNERFLAHGQQRYRRAMAVYLDGALVGLALLYVSSIPMNFSYLCNRTEVLVHPDVPESDRRRIVHTLAAASIHEAAKHGSSLTVLLIGNRDKQEAVKAGYQDSGKAYSCLCWTREDNSGAPSARHAIERLYAVAARAEHSHHLL